MPLGLAEVLVGPESSHHQVRLVQVLEQSRHEAFGFRPERFGGATRPLAFSQWLGIPESDCAVARAGHQGFAVRTEGERLLGG